MSEQTEVSREDGYAYGSDLVSWSSPPQSVTITANQRDNENAVKRQPSLTFRGTGLRKTGQYIQGSARRRLLQDGLRREDNLDGNSCESALAINEDAPVDSGLVDL